jgi:putative membrane protein
MDAAMQASIDAFVRGFPHFLLYGGVSLALVAVGATLHVLLTPMKELTLLRAGNASAGVALAAMVVGLTLPIASCLASSLSIWDLVIWGVVAMLLQMLAFRAADLLLRELPGRIERDEIGAAVVLAAVKLASAVVMAAALWDPNAGRI